MHGNNAPLKVCIDARFESGILGGLEQALIGLAHGLSALSDGDEEYFYLIANERQRWLEPYLGARGRFLKIPEQPAHGCVQALKQRPHLKRILTAMAGIIGPAAVRIPQSDGTIERAGIDVVHFPAQMAFVTRVPSIYQPWDLQHRHFPEFFSRYDWVCRETLYRRYCHDAAAVCVASQWTKKDLIDAYAIAPEKISVIPMAPPIAAYPQPTEADKLAARARYSLPPRYLFYPAQTWPHKNHLALLEALASLNARGGQRIPLVLTGRRTEFFQRIRQRIAELGLADQVLVLDFVGVIELQSILQMSTALVFPSKFEGWGLPVTEAFLAGVPVACSNVTSLPEQTGDAALLFDPERPEQVAEAIQRLWSDAALRETLIARGKKQVAQFTWERTARSFRAHYRRIGGRELSEEDRVLLGLNHKSASAL